MKSSKKAAIFGFNALPKEYLLELKKS
jgi:hypothetical protein